MERKVKKCGLEVRKNYQQSRIHTMKKHLPIWLMMCGGPPENEYKFEYKRVVRRDSWTWRIYIISMPEHFIIKNYSNISGRWIPDHENGKKFVCWNGNITKLEDAILISKLWADMHQRYIATGEFDI